MKTLLFEKGDCHLSETSAPTPGPGQVLLRLRGTVVDETHLCDYRSGELQAPYLVAGEVLQPGQKVIDFRRGQPVVTVINQPLCQYLVVRQEQLIPVDHPRAASCLLLGIAMAQKAIPAGERYPESTVIGGAGFVGLTLAALLPTTTPWVFGRTEPALLCARELGAAHCKEWEDALEELDQHAPRERGFGAVFLETTGRQEERSWAQTLGLKGGSVVCAVPPGAESEELDIDATRLHYDQITWEATGQCTAVEVAKAALALDRIPDSLITERIPFDGLERAFQELDAERAICFLVSDEPES